MDFWEDTVFGAWWACLPIQSRMHACLRWRNDFLGRAWIKLKHQLPTLQAGIKFHRHLFFPPRGHGCQILSHRIDYSIGRLFAPAKRVIVSSLASLYGWMTNLESELRCIKYVEVPKLLEPLELQLVEMCP